MALTTLAHPPNSALDAAWCKRREDERAFLESYDWSLNPYLTLDEALPVLRRELDKFSAAPSGWRTREIAINVFLLTAGLLNCADEVSRGPTLRTPSVMMKIPGLRAAISFADAVRAKATARKRAAARAWRDQWLPAFEVFLESLARDASEPADYLQPARDLALALRPPPEPMRNNRLPTPSPFSRLDLTHRDVLALAERYVARRPERSQKLALVGLRTSGSYFAPLLKACLTAKGFANVAVVSIEPNKGAGPDEARALARLARNGFSALVVDDPPHSFSTIRVTIDALRRSGFAQDAIGVLAPVHPASADWPGFLPDGLAIVLPPDAWDKRQRLELGSITPILSAYFPGCANFRVTDRTGDFADALRGTASETRSERLKRVFEIRFETERGDSEQRLILAKSVGWGYFAYPAAILGERLTGFAPGVIGLCDGLLLMDFIAPSRPPSRAEAIERSASYIAARRRLAPLSASPSGGMDLGGRNNAARLAEKALSRAYGRFPTDILMRSRVGARLRRLPCPCPTLIDGNMQREEWLANDERLVKIDYEHHGLGKAAPNVTDPAFDLATSILEFELSPEEERRFLELYKAMSGDVAVEQRLFPHKLFAGFWAMNQARGQLFGKSLPHDAQRLHDRRFLAAWNFLTVQCARACGAALVQAAPMVWLSPIVFLDVDGVIDRRLFGFPTTSAAGVEALWLLRAHEISVAINTARSVSEVKDYCAAYGLCGGVAEHGGFLWDEVSRTGRALISPQAQEQLELLRRRLRQIPGVFLDERHLCSIRAYTYQESSRGGLKALLHSRQACEIGDGALAPLSSLVIGDLMTSLKLDALSYHHTQIDTTITARDVNKGTGLVALRDLVLGPDAETVAVGDQEPDLAMFKVATRSFAPANTSVARQARLLGSRVVARQYQNGLLDIAHAITQSGDKTPANLPDKDDIFFDLLRAADRPAAENFIKALLDPASYRIFVKG